MMQIVSVKSQGALSGVQQNLREGDFVFARVLKNLGGGNYLVSFAGGRFAAKSAQNLVAGQTFRAQISLAGQNVALKIIPGAAEQGGENIVKAFSVLSPEASEFLAALGLPVDGVSAKILQSMTQSGFKLDARFMQKIRRLAQKFKGRESEAAEAALALEEKGVDSDSAALDQIMDALEGRGGQESQDGAANQDASDNQNGGRPDNDGAAGQEGAASQNASTGQGADYERIFAEVKRFFDFAAGFGGATGLANPGDSGDAAAALTEQNAGALALFNHLRGGDGSARQERKGWLLFPFEYQINSDKNSPVEDGKGALRLYLDYEKAQVEKMTINFKSICANLFFALYFESKKVRKLIISSDDKKSLDLIGQENLETLAKSLGLASEIQIADFDNFSAFGAEDLPVFGVEGFA